MTSPEPITAQPAIIREALLRTAAESNPFYAYQPQAYYNWLWQMWMGNGTSLPPKEGWFMTTFTRHYRELTR